MLAHLKPGRLHGTVPAIASKSMAHRLIIAAALANGETHVVCNTTCADIDATVRCLEALGSRIEIVEDGFNVHPTMKSSEFGLLRALAGGTLDCGESGSERMRRLSARGAWGRGPFPHSQTSSSPQARSSTDSARSPSRRTGAYDRERSNSPET